MDGNLDYKFRLNMNNYVRDIDRITRKYAGLSDDVNLDLKRTSNKVLCHHIHKCQLKMSLLEPNTSIDSGEQSLRAQDTNDTQQWDNTLQECELADETDLGSNHSAQDEVSGINNTQLSQSFLDLTQGNQPEDQDEELENTLSSHSTSLVELYPRMIDQLSKAVHSQHQYRRHRFLPNASHINHTLNVSVRAQDLTNPKKNKGKVVRKRSPNRSLLMNLTPGKTTEAVKQSYLHDVTNQQDQQTEIVCRTKKADPVESKYRPDVLIEPSFVTKILQRQQHLEPTESRHQRDQPTGRSRQLTIDGFRSQSPRSGREDIRPLLTSNTAHEKESFTVTDSSAACSSPVRRSPFKTWLRNLESQSGMSHALSPSPKSDTAGSHCRHLGESRSRSASPLSSPQKSIMSPRKHHYYSPSQPDRQSPFKTWLRNLESQSGMSHALSPSPKSDTAGSLCRHPGESRSRSASPLSSTQKSIMSPRKHHYYSPSQSKVNSCQSPSRIPKLHTAQRQSHCRHPAFTRSRSESPHSSLQKLTMSSRKHHHCSDSPSQPKIYLRQSTTGTGHSVDISTSHDSSSIQYYPKKIDMEFQRVYHRLVCLGKPVSFYVPPCSVCTRHMDANRAMAALALSPHRSLLRKRHRELDSESPRSNKRDRCDVNSPGSLRHLRENLKSSSSRRLLYSTGPDASTDYHTYSHSKATIAQGPGPQLHPCQE